MFGKLQKGIKGIFKKIKIKELSDKDLDPIIEDLINLLIRNEVAVQTAEELGRLMKEEFLKMEHSRFKTARPMVEEALTKAVLRILSHPEEANVDLISKVNEVKKEGRPMVILVLGINGTGKTTTIAKITHLLKKNEFSVVLAASDTYRSGAIQQLGIHAKKLNVRLISQDYGADPAAVAIDALDHAEAKNVDVVIIDTAGRMQNNINLIRELEKICRITDPDLKIFIGDSLAGNDVVRQAKEFQEAIGIDGIIMTKLDSDVKGGAVLSVAHSINKQILYLGVGQSYEHLQPFEPEFIVKQLLPD